MTDYTAVVTDNTSPPSLNVASAMFHITITANLICKLKRVDLLFQGVGYVRG